VDLKPGHYARDGIEVIDVRGEIDIYTAPRLRELLINLVSTGSCQLVVNLDKGGVPRFHRPRGAGRGPEAGAGPRRLAGSGLHPAADPEDLEDHRADGGLRRLRDCGPGHRGLWGAITRVRSCSAGFSRDHQAALWYSLISPLTVVRRLIRAVMSMASPGSCIGG
jgi:hypothetical protein